MYTTSVMMLLIPWVYDSASVPFAQQWLSPVKPKFQFRSRGVHPNSVKTGARKLKAVTIKIESQTMT